MPSEMSVRRTFQRLLGILKNYRMKVMRRRGPKDEPTESYFKLERNIAKCMMRADSLKSHGYPLRTEMTATKQIPTSHVFSKDDRELKESPVKKLYRRAVPRTRTNKKARSSTDVLRRKTNQNVL